MKRLFPSFSAHVFASPVKAQVGLNVDELAKELAKPGAANAAMHFQLEYRTFPENAPGNAGTRGTRTYLLL